MYVMLCMYCNVCMYVCTFYICFKYDVFLFCFFVCLLYNVLCFVLAIDLHVLFILEIYWYIFFF